MTDIYRMYQLQWRGFMNHLRVNGLSAYLAYKGGGIMVVAIDLPDLGLEMWAEDDIDDGARLGIYARIGEHDLQEEGEIIMLGGKGSLLGERAASTVVGLVATLRKGQIWVEDKALFGSSAPMVS